MNTWLMTFVPFLLFLLVIVVFEIRQKRREKVIYSRTNSYLRPLAKTTGQMFERQYGRPATDIEKAFPEIKKAK